MKSLGIMKDCASQSPMRKFKVIEPTLNINRSERYFGVLHFNQFGTLLGAPVSFVTHFEMRTTLIYTYIQSYILTYFGIYVYIHTYIPVHMYMYLCLYMYVCICMHVYVCM